jgi:hypothetical protein
VIDVQPQIQRLADEDDFERFLQLDPDEFAGGHDIGIAEPPDRRLQGGSDQRPVVLVLLEERGAASRKHGAQNQKREPGGAPDKGSRVDPQGLSW